MADVIPGNPGTVRGALIGVRINGQFVSCETNCEFHVDVDMLPASPPASGRWKSVIPGLRNWTMTVDGNLLLASVGADVKTVLNAIITGELVELEFRTRTGIAPYLIIAGNGYPQSADITAASTGKAKWNVVFQGDGPFTTDFETFWLIINSMPIEADYPIIINEDI